VKSSMAATPAGQVALALEAAAPSRPSASSSRAARSVCRQQGRYTRNRDEGQARSGYAAAAAAGQSLGFQSARVWACLSVAYRQQTEQGCSMTLMSPQMRGQACTAPPSSATGTHPLVQAAVVCHKRLLQALRLKGHVAPGAVHRQHAAAVLRAALPAAAAADAAAACRLR
jgi:hypothetical protein